MSFIVYLKKLDINPQEYLSIARDRAESKGLSKSLLNFSDNNKKKLSYDGILFGANNYNDFIIYSILEKRGKFPSGYASKMRERYQNSHSQIKGDWKNKLTPNQLSLWINW